MTTAIAVTFSHGAAIAFVDSEVHIVEKLAISLVRTGDVRFFAGDPRFKKIQQSSSATATYSATSMSQHYP